MNHLTLNHLNSNSSPKIVDELLAQEILEITKDSPWASPLLLVPKKTGEWRMCVDYRKVNESTTPYANPFSKSRRPCL